MSKVQTGRAAGLVAMRAAGLAVVVLLAGCASTRNVPVPADADEVASGTGTVAWEARRPGDLWVYDTDAKKMLYTGRVGPGDKVRVSAGTDRITVGGSTVSERPIGDSHEYKIYYRR